MVVAQKVVSPNRRFRIGTRLLPNATAGGKSRAGQRKHSEPSCVLQLTTKTTMNSTTQHEVGLLKVRDTVREGVEEGRC